MVGNVILLSGMRADVVSAPGYGLGHCGVDGNPLGGRPPLALGGVQDVSLQQGARPGRMGRYTPGVTDYATTVASSAGAGSVGALGAVEATARSLKWWHWALMLGGVAVVYGGVLDGLKK